MSTHRGGTASPSYARSEDRELLVVAAAIGRDLGRIEPRLYWIDLGLTALVAYAAFGAAMFLPFGWMAGISGIVCLLAFYRGISFIHELAHARGGALPGFRSVWNLLFGVPLLMPSFMYDDVHIIHHMRASYGTPDDPEYLPLATMGRGYVCGFVALSALAPFGLLLRFALLSPLGLLDRRLRRRVITRYSSLAINPSFRRRAPSGAFRREWIFLEAVTSLWAMTIVIATMFGAVAPRTLVTALLIGSGVALINQVRTTAAHLWENGDGRRMTLSEQYLDSVNVPPPATLPALWAPVGLRYHGLHHLLPSVPYHNLGEAHRRLRDRSPAGSSFHRADHSGLIAVLRRLLRETKS